MLKKISCILLITGLVLFAMPGCKLRQVYRWQGRKWEDILALFENEKSMFEEIGDVFSANERFWEEYRTHEYDTTAWLASPYDEKLAGIFSERDHGIITRFFERTHPYRISVAHETVKIAYIDEKKAGYFQFIYYCGGAIDNWLAYANKQYPGLIALGDNWFTYPDGAEGVEGYTAVKPK